MRRVARLGRSCSWSMALLLVVTAAGAAPPTEPAPMAAGGAEERAEALLARAKVMFHEGEYRQALPLVQDAYNLTLSPRFLFNLGVLHHKLSECVPARDHFELYLQRDPTGAARVQALAALQELRAVCPAPPVSPAVPVAPALLVPTHGLPETGAAPSEGRPQQRALDSAESNWAPGTSALLLMGLGTAAGIGAVASFAAQGRAQEDLDALASRTVGDAGVTWDELEGERQELAADARLYRGLSIGLSVASVALVGAGVTVWIVEVGDGANQGSGGASIAYRNHF